jgi:V/A-type H+-transporting ATPase subunit E
MAGAEKLIQKILDEARSQAKQHVEQAEQEAGSIIRTAQEEAEAKRIQLLEKASKEAEEIIKRASAVAGLEARKQKLGIKRDVIATAFEKALDELVAMPEAQYVSVMAEMIAASVKSGNAEVMLSEGDRQKYKSLIENGVNNRLKDMGTNIFVIVSDETRNIKGGFILKAGDVEINNSFETLIRTRREELEPEIVEILFNS